MRLLTKLYDLQKGKNLNDFLVVRGIKTYFEIEKTDDWKSDDYGVARCLIWIVEEDHFSEAQQIFEEFNQDPHHPKFQEKSPFYTPVNEEKESEEDLAPSTQMFNEVSRKLFSAKQRLQEKPPIPPGKATTYLLIGCIWLFLWCKLTAPPQEPYPSYLPGMAILTSPVTRELLFDYPLAYTLANKLVTVYGLEKLENPNSLPIEGKALLKKFLETRTWNGIYDDIVALFKGTPVKEGPRPILFEKIGQGEIWRLFTPCLLHSDIFHLFFNMAWLLIIGRQIESRIGIPRFLLFIVVTGIFTNTAQYLMSGPNFIGFSGVLCAMITFVWVRQSRAPWEGYQLQPSTMGLISLFVLLMLLIQLASFFADVLYDKGFTPGIANTAHLSGAFLGYILGKVNLFKWRSTNG